jgi:hypothetical protein
MRIFRSSQFLGEKNIDSRRPVNLSGAYGVLIPVLACCTLRCAGSAPSSGGFRKPEEAR